MEQKYCLRKIYKIHSKKLKRANWNLTMSLEEALRDSSEEIVSISSSQLLRFMDELNDAADTDKKIRHVQNQIKAAKKQPRSRERRALIKGLYAALYNLQFQKDYVCVIMDSDADYDRANNGFTINGIKFRRFLGTNGGVKNSTIIYVNAELYPALKKKLDNGRKTDVPLIAAKLEAYQALICSGSTPLPPPCGVIVVDDCITHFKENVILISDADGEPNVEYVNDYEIEHNDSDGYGLMLPSYSRKVNECLTGDGENTIAGFNSRWAWTKGMVYTFDYIEFAEQIAGTYEITDVWGTKRDVRNAEVILTASMLKLWNCYDSWEDYYDNCIANGYAFSAAKVTPPSLERVRLTNYQFLQSYELSDNELTELCQPTIDELKDVLGMDYRKSLVFMAGLGLNDYNVFNDERDHIIKALMVEPKLINDSFVRDKIWSMIAKRIEMAKRGSIRVKANYAMISGDPYALCQSMFGLEITGLLHAGEVYHKYWIDKGTSEICCFRAPMSVRNNIRRMKLNTDKESAYWYRYIDTALILNAFDTTCDALNGADKDGDTCMCTDNPVLLKNTPNDKTIICMQKNAEKRIPTEADIIAANKIAFNDDIGIITNHVTTMFERRAGFDKDSEEYKVLTYRMMCGQKYQQDTID